MAQQAKMYSDLELRVIIPEAYDHDSDSDYDFLALLNNVEDFINRVTQTIGDHSQDDLLESRKAKHGLPYQILLVNVATLSDEITTRILNGMDAHETTMWLLISLAKCSWEVRVIATLITFALTFGDFWLLVRIYSRNAIDEPMTTVGPSEATTADIATTANIEAYKNHFEAVNGCIKGLVSATRYLFEIGELPDSYSVDKSVRDRIPIAAYWIMRSAIVAATQMIILSARGPDQYLMVVSEPEELKKLGSINDDLRTNLTNLYNQIGEKEITKVFNAEQTDNIKIMRSLTNQDGSTPPLFHAVTKKTDHLDVLRTKHLLLLISGLGIDPKDISNIENNKSNSKTHEILWIPIVSRTIPWTNKQFETLQNTMPWYSLSQPSMIKDAAIMFFRSQWAFKNRPILVILSPQGKVLNKNAIHILRIWHKVPIHELTRDHELQLWKNETWNLKLLVNDIDPTINTEEWIQDDKYIFLYGDDEIDWIRTFTSKAQSVASTLQIKIEMVYVGSNHHKDHVRRVVDTIMEEKLSHCLSVSSMVYFWSRIESMIYSKAKLGKLYDHDDKLLQDILRLHCHTRFALLAKGSRILVHGPGDIALKSLEEIEDWRSDGVEPGYVNQFQNHYKSVHQCNALFLPATDNVPDRIICPDCHRSMDNFDYIACC